MSPRPAPTPTDATAQVFVAAALRLVDASLAPGPRAELPPRLRALHFPAPLDWIRVEDVVREARQEGHRLSQKAFWNRWPDKDSFLVDVAASAFADDPVPQTRAGRWLLLASDAPQSERIRFLATTLMTELLSRPRAHLLGFLAPIVQASATLEESVMEAATVDVRGWAEFYDAMVAAAGLRWRPGWDSGRAQVVLQSLIDGLLIRSRLIPVLPGGAAWDPITTFADAVIAMLSSMVDLNDDGRTVPQVLDDGVAAVARSRASSTD